MKRILEITGWVVTWICFGIVVAGVLLYLYMMFVGWQCNWQC
jgi:hypothetical protein